MLCEMMARYLVSVISTPRRILQREFEVRFPKNRTYRPDGLQKGVAALVLGTCRARESSTQSHPNGQAGWNDVIFLSCPVLSCVASSTRILFCFMTKFMKASLVQHSSELQDFSTFLFLFLLFKLYCSM